LLIAGTLNRVNSKSEKIPFVEFLGISAALPCYSNLFWIIVSGHSKSEDSAGSSIFAADRFLNHTFEPHI
ncbi:hypothetical protein KA005_63030, partial [bacterium]|nr:hypothetical protein [bacterium]